MPTSTLMIAMTASSSMSVKPPELNGERGALALGLVDDPPGQGRLLASDGIGLLGKLGGELWVGVEGALDTTRDRPAGTAELRAASERCRKPGAKDEWEAVRLGHEGRDRADRPGNGPTGRIVLVIGRGDDGVVGGGELVPDDGELGSPAIGEIGRGRRIFQGLAQGTLSSGQRITQHAKILAR
jgi:hypothetical protein